MIRRLIAIVLASACTWSCSGADSARSTAVGAATWVVPGAPLVVIGETEGADEYLFQRIQTARILPDGRIVVADRGRSAVRLYGPDGTWHSDFGRSGEGPGEFKYIGGLRITQPDTIEVYDALLYRLTRFIAGGEIVSTRSFTADSGFPEQYLGRFRNGDHGLAWIDQGPRDLSVSSADPMLFGRFDASGSQIDIIGRANGMVREGRGPVPFSPNLYTFLVNDSIYFTDGRQAQISVLDSEGNAVRKFSAPDRVQSPERAWRQLEAELRSRDDAAALVFLDQVSDRQLLPQISVVLIDDGGQFWLKRYEPLTDSHWLGGWAGARGGHWDVLDPAEGLVATVEVPGDLILLDVRADRLLGMTRGALGVERVMLYELQR